MRKIKYDSFIKIIVLLVLSGLCFWISFAFADTAGGEGLSGIAANVQKSFGPLAKLITGCAFLAGLGFAFASILKFKAHRDNPTQIPVGTPIALLLVAVALMFLPFLFRQAGRSLFGTATPGSVSGVPGLSGV